MSNVTSELVKKLREKTGAGMMDCKNALIEANGNMETAVEVLRKKGLKDISKRSGKIAAEGTLGVYVHPGDQVVAVVELNCETDFVARNEKFKVLAKDLAMHVAAMKPMYLDETDIPKEALDKEIEIIKAQMDEKQLSKLDKVLPGKISKYMEEVVFLKQGFVKDETGSKTIKDLIQELSMQVGEKIQIRRFLRFQVGEGVEKTQTNLAQEVASMTGIM